MIESRHEYEDQATIALIKLASSKATLRKDITADLWGLAQTTLENLTEELKTTCRE